MGKSSAAPNVIDLETFRQRRMQARAESAMPATMPSHGAVVVPIPVPVWVCWVPVWAPMFA